MDTKELIPIQQFCTHYDIPVSFINALNEFELIEVVLERETSCIHKAQIKEIEKMMRMHYELEINMEGIDVIYNLLKQLDSLQEEVTALTNKLKFYEDNG